MYEVDADELDLAAKESGNTSDCGTPESPVGGRGSQDTGTDAVSFDSPADGPSLALPTHAQPARKSVQSSLSFSSFKSFNPRGSAHGERGSGLAARGGGRGPRPYGIDGRNPMGADRSFNPNLPVIHPVVHPGGADPHGYQQTALKFENSGPPTSSHPAPSFGQLRPPRRGPHIHPDRLRNISRGGVREPPKENRPSVAPVRERREPTVASILPEDGLRDRVLEGAERERLANEAVQKRKRPGSSSVRKRPRVDGGDAASASREPPAKAARGKTSAPRTANFGNLMALAAGGGVDAIRKASSSRSQPSLRSSLVGGVPAGQARRGKEGGSGGTVRNKRSVYVEATTTKEGLEREERRRREEEERIDAEFQQRRKEERHERRLIAERMRRIPTVSASMRDSHVLDRVERHLFNDEQGKMVRDSLAHLKLFRKDFGTDAMAEELLTVVIEEF